MRLSIARRYFWVAQTCVWLRVYACVKVQTDLTLTLTPPQGKGRGCLWGKGNATGKWKSKSKSTLQLQLQCEWTIAQCKCETRKLILRRVWRLSVCPSVCLSVELLCLFICLARSSLPHAVARHPCPALPCPAAPWLAVQVRRLRLRLRLGRMHYYLRGVKCKQDVRASHKAVWWLRLAFAAGKDGEQRRRFP